MIPPTQNHFTTDDSKALAAMLEAESAPIHDQIVREFHDDEMGLDEIGSNLEHISRAATIAYWSAFGAAALVLVVCGCLWVANPDWRA